MYVFWYRSLPTNQVIDALVLKKPHVPYYESKLTLLLAPALGGNARTTVLCCCSPDKAKAPTRAPPLL